MIHGSSEELFDCQKTDPLLKNSFIVKECVYLLFEDPVHSGINAY